MPELTQEFVRARLDYNPETGILTWKARDRSEFSTERAWKIWMSNNFGKVAGSARRGVGKNGVRVLGTSVPRVIWLWVYGYIPKLLIHKNGDTYDDRLGNLTPHAPLPKGQKEDREKVTQEYARELFDYDKETGKLYWRIRPREHFKTTRGWITSNAKHAGKEVGCAYESGHLMVKIGLRTWPVHRVVWLMHTGELPETLDHINRIPSDNRIENLRPCTDSENIINSKKRAAGKVAGVYVVRPGVWKACLRVRGELHYLGCFRSWDAAKQAYEKCLRENFGEFVPNV